MILKHLKLAGFKSFVDPLTIPLQASLVAVVGPNGCGKSNIIDAVRWVMGESAAKSLRGETMSDVIFNGSAQRKALGQASVELVFDNSMGGLTGQYGAYQELSVKRLVTRDGDSAYFLNGSRCRRRDITDIFLGTGAGSRSYSIIGQGTISRLIEARPEELRVYLEEAAGISKYKERRRETTQRIAATRDNLTRVADIREELVKQLARLEQQAKTAQRYKNLCEEERRLKAEIAVLKYLAFEEQRSQLQRKHQQLQLEWTAHQTHAVEAYQHQVEANLQLNEVNDAHQVQQSAYYQLKTDIARLEEQILHQQQERERLLAEQVNLHRESEVLTQHIEQDKALQQQVQIDQNILAQQLIVSEDDLQDKLGQIQTLRIQLSDLDQQIIALQQSRQQHQNEVALAATTIQHHQQRAQDIRSRLHHISAEQASLKDSLEEGLITALTQQKNECEVQAIASETELSEAKILASTLSEKQKMTHQSVQQAQDRVYQLTTQLAALQGWIAQALGRESTSFDSNESRTRWVEVIQVDKPWQAICEKIFGDLLQSMLVDDLAPWMSTLPAQDPLMGMMTTPKKDVLVTSRFVKLMDKISGVRPHHAVNLDKIYAADNFQQALDWLPFLDADESIVTRDGAWLGSGWLRWYSLKAAEETSLLARQDEATQIKLLLAEAQIVLDAELTARALIDEQYAQHDEYLQSLQSVCREHREQLAHSSTVLMNQQRASEQITLKIERLKEEQTELEEKLEGIILMQVETEQQRVAYEALLHEANEQCSLLHEERNGFQLTLTPYEQAAQEAQQSLHTLTLQRERTQLQLAQLTTNLLRDESRLTDLKERQATLLQQLNQLSQPDEPLQVNLADKLQNQQVIDQLMIEQRAQIQSLHAKLTHYTQLNKTESEQAVLLKDQMQQMQIEIETLGVQARNQLEGLTALEQTFDAVSVCLPSDATVVEHEQALIGLVEKIKRLGAINLAAIEEYQTELARKTYLDQQVDDLTEALALLDAAIVKMDNETRQRFQAMFNEVNQGFQILFPRLFGGGQARLELIGDNLLDAGVMVMANPPGKRNSTIHLLSGGEKAMTALALIFAIFQLNPAPFCLLDEVDAPLDEENVARLCRLMKEMANMVQFIFITHNKVTMQLAEQLIGVTMKEQGVSRIVAVDVDQALSMSDTST